MSQDNKLNDEHELKKGDIEERKKERKRKRRLSLRKRIIV